jgi:NAD+ diphosphatase
MRKEKETYCCFCGVKLGSKDLFDGTTEKYCANCDYVFFPNPSAVVTVMITRDKKILLARGVGWDHEYWGLIAGHIQPGESAEDAARREVSEEVDLSLANLKFLESYATKTDRDNLILAFHGEAESDDIKISQELTVAKWFDLGSVLPIRKNSIIEKLVQKLQLGVEIV